MNNSLFLKSVGQGSLVEKKWMRFSKWTMNDYFYLDSSAWDAICYVPTKKIFLLGFGIFSGYNKPVSI